MVKVSFSKRGSVLLSIFFFLFFGVSGRICQAGSFHQSCFGGSDGDEFESVAPLSDGGLLIAGSTWSTDGDASENVGGLSNGWLVKLDSSRKLQWQRGFGGGDLDDLKQVVTTSDDGCFVVGNTYDVLFDKFSESANFCSYGWVVKLNSVGDVQWNCWFDENEIAYSAVQAYDNGFMVVGNKMTVDEEGPDDCCLLVKLDDSGNIQWKKELNVGQSGWIRDITYTNDDSYFIAGSVESEGFVAKLNSSGEIRWQRHLVPNRETDFRSVATCKDGGCLVAGHTRSVVHGDCETYSDWDGVVVKLDSSGNVLWETRSGGDMDDVLFTLFPAEDGGLLAAGYTESDCEERSVIDLNHSVNHGEKDGWVINLNSLGEVQWQHRFGGKMDDCFRSIVNTSEGEYLAVGTSGSSDGDVLGNHGGDDGWLMEVNEHNYLTDGLNPEDIASSALPASDQIGKFVEFSDVAFGDGALYAEVTFNSPQLVTGIVDYWETKLSIASPLYIESIFLIESADDKKRKLRDKVVMKIGSHVIDLMGGGIFLSFYDAFKDLQEAFDDKSAINEIKIEGDASKFKIKMLVKMKSHLSMSREEWPISISGKYVQPNQSWSFWGSDKPMPIRIFMKTDRITGLAD